MNFVKGICFCLLKYFDIFQIFFQGKLFYFFYDFFLEIKIIQRNVSSHQQLLHIINSIPKWISNLLKSKIQISLKKQKLNNSVELRFDDMMQIATMFFQIQNISSLAKPEALDIEPAQEGFEDFVNHRMNSVSTPGFKIHFFTSLTNLRIILVTDPKVASVDNLFRNIYLAYSDYISKDASYVVREFF